MFKKQSELLPVYDESGVESTTITVTYHFYKKNKERFFGVEFLFDENICKYPLDILKMWINKNEELIPLIDYYNRNQIIGYIKIDDAKSIVSDVAVWFSKKSMI